MDDEWSPHALGRVQGPLEAMFYAHLPIIPWGFAPFLGAEMALPTAAPLTQLASAPPVVWVIALLGLAMTTQRAGRIGAAGYALATVMALLMLNSALYLPLGMVAMIVIIIGLVRTQLTAFEEELAAADG